ncbi:hypothetical protein AURDEDRAFT_178096 [Auricularia subglabra TFB-10046 SS5]|uniref:Uncharacterized protein n=1 Tax=Auricularia subglabra (strain TFB-10046 / SS5) TaxID=717982 RepID=J0D2F6_AURST|nr:hypothetical protein AURDEDRAFT_178096 [Auricularia subglabra TFB-10046 SS5]
MSSGAPRLPLWEFFHSGELQNVSQHKAYCLACVAQLRPAGVPLSVEHYMGIDAEAVKEEAWFTDACNELEAKDYGMVRGAKDPMISHLVGKKNKCPYATDRAREVAIELRDGNSAPKASGAGKRKAGAAADNEPKRIATQSRVEQFIQPKLQTFKGIDIPFNKAQISAIQDQCLRATVSANLPFRWIEDPEVIALFLMFRSAACDALPSRKVLSDRLLDKAADEAEAATNEALHGQNVTLSTDGWKDVSKNAVASVNLAVAGESFLVDVLRTNGDGKDGPSMAKAFEQMIDKAEEKYKCRVVKLTTDNDGGARAGREKVGEDRKWVLTDPCMAHQGQLILGDYLKENPKAAEAGDQASDVVGWLWNHQRVREVFDISQREANKSEKALSYLVGNTTRWTTHMVAFHRLVDLKDVLQRAVYTHRDDIIAAHIGAEKGKKKKAEMERAARSACRTILDSAFWDELELAANDLEPIAYMTNINQTDATRPDQVVLSFAGVWIFFSKHALLHVRRGMMKRIEKRWKELDQATYIFALILNPYEQLDRFGDKAELDVLTLNLELIALYRRCNSRPLPASYTQEQRDGHMRDMASTEKRVCEAFLEYCADKGIWAKFRAGQEVFMSVHGTDPVAVWRQMTAHATVRDLADFAIMLLQLTSHQGGNERVFSDMGIKKTKLRNRLGLKKLEKMCKVGAHLRREHMKHGLVEKRTGRKNHKESRVEQLLAVPRYAEALDGDILAASGDTNGTGEDSESVRKSTLVTSSAAWRREVARWKAAEDETDDEEDAQETSDSSRRSKSFFPRSLALLFGGAAKRPANPAAQTAGSTADKPRSTRWSKEQLYMELLAAEWDGEEPDDGALEGSGDEYEE